MNWLDILLLIILAYSVFRSFRKGFSREIIGLAAAFFSILLAMWFYGMASVLFLPYVSSQRVANLIGFIAVVAAVLLLGSLAGWIVNRFLRTVGLSIFDRFLGAAFGLARGLLIAIALLTAWLAFGAQVDSANAPAAVLNSRIAPYVLRASRAFVALAPMDLKQSFLKTLFNDSPEAEPTGKTRTYMNENLDTLIDRMIEGNFFLEQAVEILERGMIERVLRRETGNQSKASQTLGIHRNTLLRKMLAYGIDGKRPHSKPPARATAKKIVRRPKAS